MVEGKKYFTCPFENCNKSFSVQSKLKRHINDHNGERPFSCSFEGCNKTFTRKTHVKRHELTHTKEKPFKCTEEGCNQAYYTKQNLNKHIKTHLIPKPFICTYNNCNEKFSKKNQLQRHQCKHTGEKPYACEYIDNITNIQCPWKFDYPSQLKRHQLTHIKEEPSFYCGYLSCKECFYTNNELLDHIKQNHTPNLKVIQPEINDSVLEKSLDYLGNEVFCTLGDPICGRSFQNQQCLNDHIRRFHKKNDRIQCPLCLKYYANKQSLKIHSSKCSIGNKRSNLSNSFIPSSKYPKIK